MFAGIIVCYHLFTALFILPMIKNEQFQQPTVAFTRETEKSEKNVKQLEAIYDVKWKKER